MQWKRVMNHRYKFTFLSIIFIITYWAIDSYLHYLYLSSQDFTLMPHNNNELIMRLIITIMLVSFGYFSDYHIKTALNNSHEKNDIYRAMLSATNHILNNYLQRMQYFRLHAEKDNILDQELLSHYDRVIKETADQIKALDNIEYPTKDKIIERYLKEFK